MNNAHDDKIESLISIIMPVYYRGDLLSETLDAIIKQAHLIGNALWSDDSSDNTIEVAERYVNLDARFSLFNSPENYKPGGNSIRNWL